MASGTTFAVITLEQWRTPSPVAARRSLSGASAAVEPVAGVGGRRPTGLRLFFEGVAGGAALLGAVTGFVAGGTNVPRKGASQHFYSTPWRTSLEMSKKGGWAQLHRMEAMP